MEKYQKFTQQIEDFQLARCAGYQTPSFLMLVNLLDIHFRRFLDIWWIPLNKHKLVMVYPFIPTILSLVGFIIPRISHQLLVKICFNFAQAQLPRGRFHFLKPSFISIDKMLNLVINQLTVQGALLLSTNNSTNKLP